MFARHARRRGFALPAHPLLQVLFGPLDPDMPDTSDMDDRRPRSRHRRGSHGHGPFSGGPFGGRRPLRHLARRLGLDDEQIDAISRVISDMKTERAQLALDSRRAAARFADALSAEEFDEDSALQAQTLRADAQKRYVEAVARCLREIHAVLDLEQRRKLSMLVREAPPWAL